MSHNIEFEGTECCMCGTFFYIQKNLYEQRQRDHINFYCPNGHPLCFKKPKDDPEVTKLRVENTRLIQQVDQLEAKLAEKSNGVP